MFYLFPLLADVTLNICLWITTNCQVNSFVLFLADLLGSYSAKKKLLSVFWQFPYLAVSLFLRALLHAVNESLPLPFKFTADILASYYPS